jgi:hypothetical protein
MSGISGELMGRVSDGGRSHFADASDTNCLVIGAVA